MSHSVGVYFEVNGKTYHNNSVLNILEFGEGDNALLCKTNMETCCQNPNRRGQFYYPNGERVPNKRRGEGFYRNRDVSMIRLHRKENINSPTGTFRCEIPDTSGERKNIYITLNN